MINIYLKEYSSILHCIREEEGKHKEFIDYLCENYVDNEEEQKNDLDIQQAIYNFFFEAQQEILKQIKKGSVVTLDEEVKNEQRVVFEENKVSGKYWIKGYVGIIHYRGVNIHITSRFDKDEKQPFLMYLFSRVFSENGMIFKEMPIKSNMEYTWDYLLIILFVKQLKEAFKKGLYRQYVEIYHNDYAIKGRIDMNRHIQENIIKKNPSVAYISREYSVNNPINRLILQAYNVLEKKYGRVMKQVVKQDDIILPNIMNLRNEVSYENNESPQQIIKMNQKKVVHSIYKDYEPLRKTSIAILKRLGMNSFMNYQQEVSGVLVNVPTLWENYLFKVLSEKVAKLFKKQSSLSVLNDLLNFKPDIVSEDDEIVIDAKYKRGWQESIANNMKKSEYLREDIFQIIAYMTAFDAKAGGIFFPVSSEFIENNDLNEESLEEVREQQIISSQCKEIYFFRAPFVIPNYQDSFMNFNQQMMLQEEKIQTQLKSIMEKVCKINI